MQTSTRPPVTTVREMRAEVAQSAQFVRSPALVRLLSFLIETDLAGNRALLRETYIGHKFYGREETYDPKLDAVVRVNANRLRSKLAEYHEANPGQPIYFVLPRGAYVLHYERPAPAVEVQPTGVVDGLPVAAAAEPKIAVGSGNGDVPGDGPGNRTVSRARWKNVALVAAMLLLVGTVVGVWRERKARVAAAHNGWIERPFSRAGGVAEFPVFSPNGGSIAFAWSRSEDAPRSVYVQDVGSDVPRRLGPAGTESTRPAFSPDGRRLAFIVPVTKDSKRVVVRDLVSGVERTVAHLKGGSPWLCQVPHLSWSPAGDQIYTSTAGLSTASAADAGAGLRCGIVAVDVEAGVVRVLTRSPLGTLGDVEAAVSADGSRVAFLRAVSYGAVNAYVVDANGGDLQQVTFNGREILGVAWNERGDGLILGARGEDGVIRLVDWSLRTRQAVTLTGGVDKAAFPAVSPDARQIAFVRYFSPTKLFRADQSSVTEVVADQNNKKSPELSPDGREMAYISDRTGYAELWTSQADGQGQVRVTQSNGEGVGHPHWTPDGRSLLYECWRGGHTQICVTSAKAPFKTSQLTSWTADQALPSISRDGLSFYYSSNRTGIWELYRQSFGGGAPVQVTEGGASFGEESWDGHSLYISTPGGDPGILMVPVDSRFVKTASAAQANAAYVRPELQELHRVAWTVAPGGVLFCRRAAGASRLWFYSESRRTFRQDRSLPEADAVDSVRVGAGGTVIVATRSNPTGEIDLLTAQD